MLPSFAVACCALLVTRWALLVACFCLLSLIVWLVCVVRAPLIGVRCWLFLDCHCVWLFVVVGVLLWLLLLAFDCCCELFVFVGCCSLFNNGCHLLFVGSR